MPSADRDDLDDDRPRRVKKPLKARVSEDDDDDAGPVSKRRRRTEDDDETSAASEADETDEERPVRKKKKKGKSNKKPLPGQDVAKYALWGGIAFAEFLVILAGYFLVSWLHVPAAATIDGVDWYKAPETLGRYDMLFPGGRPSHDLIRLRNPQTDVSVRAELWQRRYKGRMYEACYISGDNVTAANVNGAAQNMKNAPPPDPKAKSWVSKIVLNDGARTIVMRVYGPDQIDENDPMVKTFFENFKLP